MVRWHFPKISWGHYYKNCRKRAPYIPEITTKKKRKIDTANDEKQKNIKRHRSWGVPNFLPVFLDEEDKETMQDHCEWFRKKVKSFKRETRYWYYWQFDGYNFPTMAWTTVYRNGKLVAPRSTQSFILPRSMKWVPGISGNLVVKSKLPPRSGFSLEAVEPHP